MNILVAFNKLYMPHAKVMLTSLRTSMPEESIDVYLMYHEINQADILKLGSYLSKKHNIQLHPIRITKTPFDEIKLGMHLTIETTYRLMAASLLPDNINRILWLDCDIIINKSISKLYNTDFKSATIAVCKGRGMIANHNKRLGLPDNHTYFNAGVVLMNLKRMRENDAINSFMSIITKYGDRLTFLDQDILNIAYTGTEVKYLDSEKYNYQIDRDFKLSPENYKTFLEQCCIIHFASAAKPWKNTYINGLEKLYWKYALMDKRYIEYIRFIVTAPLISVYKRFRVKNMKRYDFQEENSR